MATAFYISYAVLWLLALFEGLVIVGLVRTGTPVSEHPAVRRRHTPDLTGQMLPHFAGHTLTGAHFDSNQLAGRPGALLFVSPDCATCAVSLEQLQALDRRMTGNVVVLCRSTHEGCRQLAERYALGSSVLEDTDGEIGDLLAVEVTPTAVLVGADGVIESYGHPMTSAEFNEQMRRLGDPVPGEPVRSAMSDGIAAVRVGNGGE
jgi:peroxiredoxin